MLSFINIAGASGAIIVSIVIFNSPISLVILQSPSRGGKDSPEQRSFRDRQKYFEIDVKQHTPDKPKPRVSLVAEDDLKKMREEEGLIPLLLVNF